MPLYGGINKAAIEASAKQCMSDFDALFNSIDYVYEMAVIGGEPFLHTELELILEHFSKQEKLGSFTVVTNGTIVPDDKLIPALKHPKCRVFISDYGKHSKNLSNLASWLNKNEIGYSVKRDYCWYDQGIGEARNRNDRELKRIFVTCRASKCQIFLHGKLHQCAISAFAMDLGLIPDNPNDYVDVTIKNAETTRGKIKDSRLKTPSITACDHCDHAFVIPAKRIIPGEQVNV